MRIGKEMGRHIGLPYGTVTRLPFPLFMLTQSTICTQALAGKGVIHKRVENRRLSTLLCARAASAHVPAQPD